MYEKNIEHNYFIRMTKIFGDILEIYNISSLFLCILILIYSCPNRTAADGKKSQLTPNIFLGEARLSIRAEGDKCCRLIYVRKGSTYALLSG